MSLRNRHRIVWSEAGLRHIRRRDVDLCIWRRAFDAPFASWCQHSTHALALEVDEVVALDGAWPVARWLSPMPACEHRARLEHEVQARLTHYGHLFQARRARVQLACVRQQTCPRFHVDNVTVRLICTWAGPATEWIAERDLDRTKLRVTNLDGARTQHLECFDVALMKGVACEGNAPWGLVHRSPPVSSSPRLVLTIDGRP